ESAWPPRRLSVCGASCGGERAGRRRASGSPTRVANPRWPPRLFYGRCFERPEESVHGVEQVGEVPDVKRIRLRGERYAEAVAERDPEVVEERQQLAHNGRRVEAEVDDNRAGCPQQAGVEDLRLGERPVVVDLKQDAVGRIAEDDFRMCTMREGVAHSFDGLP